MILNKNEKLNASYNDNSYLLFCEQIIDDELKFPANYIEENNIYEINIAERRLLHHFLEIFLVIMIFVE